MKRVFWIGLGVLLMNWLLGAGCAAGIFPLWLFLLANLPFGAAYVWMESSWTGSHYGIALWGRHLSDMDSLIVWFAVVLLQTGVYALCWRWWHGRPGHAHGRGAHATRGQ